MQVELGQVLPPLTSHAVSVSLPTWADNVGYEEGDSRVISAMRNGYPRFFIHLSIRKLSDICLAKFGKPNDEACMLFPTHRIADLCRQYIQSKSSATHGRLVHLSVSSENDSSSQQNTAQDPSAELHIVVFPVSVAGLAKQFWQHAGFGISSRFADHCLSLMGVDPSSSSSSPAPSPSKASFLHRRTPSATKPSNRHYSSTPKISNSPTTDESEQDLLSEDHSVYLEERYGRNLPLSYGPSAKRALRRRIAMVLVTDSPPGSRSSSEPPPDIAAGHKDTIVGPSGRGINDVTENDVFLYPSGMAAIWSAHHIISATRPPGKSVCFGFPYTDTLKILEKWGPGCHFFGNGLDEDLISLEEQILSKKTTEQEPPILALFTEFPSNPLLRTPDLEKLRALADKYNFLIVIDETLGNFMNVQVLPFADIVVSSLTKVFSGDANAMGGSLVLNPHSKHHSTLKEYLNQNFEDVYFDQDAIFMERNSRNFAKRIRVIDSNTEVICDWLYSRSAAVANTPTSPPVIKQVFYPKYTTPHNYEARRVKNRDNNNNDTQQRGAGYGGLFSVTFTSLEASRAFYDNLNVLKGPSLGTNFTLACPYTILAHYTELDWASQWGVDTNLVRVSVGMESLHGEDGLLRKFEYALDKAIEAAAEAVAV